MNDVRYVLLSTPSYAALLLRMGPMSYAQAAAALALARQGLSPFFFVNP